MVGKDTWLHFRPSWLEVEDMNRFGIVKGCGLCLAEVGLTSFPHSVFFLSIDSGTTLSDLPLVAEGGKRFEAKTRNMRGVALTSVSRHCVVMTSTKTRIALRISGFHDSCRWRAG